jgi:hypothetical protein
MLLTAPARRIPDQSVPRLSRRHRQPDRPAATLFRPTTTAHRPRVGLMLVTAPAPRIPDQFVPRLSRRHQQPDRPAATLFRPTTTDRPPSGAHQPECLSRMVPPNGMVVGVLARTVSRTRRRIRAAAEERKRNFYAIGNTNGWLGQALHRLRSGDLSHAPRFRGMVALAAYSHRGSAYQGPQVRVLSPRDAANDGKMSCYAVVASSVRTRESSSHRT